jgi:quercetin dioxygenase-like cupin family protein
MPERTPFETMALATLARALPLLSARFAAIRSIMITRRDLVIAGLSLVTGASLASGALFGVASADSRPPVQESTLFDWNTIPVQQTGVGQYRQLLRAPTATLEELEMHVTTLNPGQTSHAPHKHPNEEIVVLASGKLEVFSNGTTKVLGPGSVIFNASNQMHGVKNVGDVPATYHVINWTSSSTPRAAGKPPEPRGGAASTAAPAAAPARQ